MQGEFTLVRTAPCRHDQPLAGPGIRTQFEHFHAAVEHLPATPRIAGVVGDQVIRGQRVGQRPNPDAACCETGCFGKGLVIENQIGRLDQDLALRRCRQRTQGNGHGLRTR
jgi:hypothetical protein